LLEKHQALRLNVANLIKNQKSRGFFEIGLKKDPLPVSMSLHFMLLTQILKGQR